MFARAVRQHTTCAPRAAAAAAASSLRVRQPRFAPTSTTALRNFATTPNRHQSTSPAPVSPTSRRLIPRKLLIPIIDSETSQLAEFVTDAPIPVFRTVAGVRQWASETSLGARHPAENNNHNRNNNGHDDQGDQGIALVPTMGALHEGHLALIREAVRRGHDKVAVSIYVNPAQFGANEDLDSYPKTWARDCEVLRALYEELSPQARGAAGAAGLQMAVFAPTTAEMYPSGFPGQEVDSKGSFVTVTPVGELLEGAARPTFFRGVATVCMKLFNIVQPTRVFFGQKDVQQTVVIRKMVRDFHLPMDVVVVPTVRAEDDGLALSSRNAYLGSRRRGVAPVLYRALSAAEAAYVDGSLDATEILTAALNVVLDTMEEQKNLPAKDGVLFKLDYISLADPDTLEEVDLVDPSKGAILSGAVKMHPVYDPQENEDLGDHDGPTVRLIDNIILPPKA